MCSCQNKSGILIKSNRRDILEKNKINDEKYLIDTRFEDMPEWPSKNNIHFNLFLLKSNVIGGWELRG